MAIGAKERFQLRKIVHELENYRGQHTELVTVYIPAEYDLVKITQHLAQEADTASNIKSTSTRKNVEAALEKMIQHLRLYKQTPPHGLAVFSGNVSEKEGRQDVRVWSIEPPVPLKIRLYRCDKTFVLDPIIDMLQIKDVYGMIVLDRRDANIALLKGKTIVPLLKTHSEVPGKMRAGGQCLHQNTLIKTEFGEKKLKSLKKGDSIKSFDFKKHTLKNSEVLDFWKVKKNEIVTIKTKKNNTICSKDHLFFLKENTTKAAEELTSEEFLLNNIGEKVKIDSIKIKKQKIELIDISVKNQNFIANGIIVHNSAHRFEMNRELAAKAHYNKVADYVKEQFLMMDNLKGILVGGPGPTKYEFVDGNFITDQLKRKIIAIKDLGYTGEFGLQELLDRCQDVLAAEEVAKEKELMNKFFNMLAKDSKKTSYGEKEVRRVLEMGAVDILLLCEDLPDAKIEEFEKIAEQYGTTVEIISTETREGVQLRDIGMYAAMLRYEVID